MKLKAITPPFVVLTLICSYPSFLGAQSIRPLTPDLAEFLIDDGDLDVSRDWPDVAVIDDQTGEFVVVWACDSPCSQVFFKRFNSDGIEIDQSERDDILDAFGVLSDDPSPSVDGLGDGGFMMVWNDIRTSGYGSGVYGQYVNNAGEVVANNRKLDGGVEDSGTEGPEIAIHNQGDGTGVGFLSWVAVHGGAGQDDIYGRAFTFWIDPIPPDHWYRSSITNGKHLDSSTDINFDGADWSSSGIICYIRRARRSQRSSPGVSGQ